MNENRKDIATGVTLMVFSIAYLVLTSGIRVFKGDGSTPITARTMPRIWAVVMLACSCILLVRSLLRMKKAVGEEENGAKTSTFKADALEWLRHNYAVVGTFAVLILYSLLMRRLGYVLDTVLYLLIQIPLLTPKEKRKNPLTWVITLILAVLVPLLTDYLFVKWFAVRLPRGLWGF